MDHATTAANFTAHDRTLSRKIFGHVNDFCCFGVKSVLPSATVQTMIGFITTQEAANRLNFTDARVRQLILGGLIAAEKVGTVHLIPISEIQRFKRQHTAWKRRIARDKARKAQRAQAV